MIADLVEQGHHRRNGSIELENLNILCHLFDRLMEASLQRGRIAVPFLENLKQVVDTVQEPFTAFDRTLGPRRALLKVTDEHFVKAKGVRTKLPHNVIGIYDIAT